MSKTASSAKVAESGVLRACLQLLAVEHIFHRRWNSGSSTVDNGDGTKRFFRFGSKGDADILAIPNIRDVPHVLWIEMKSDTGKQTQEQKWFQKDVEARGHTYLLVRDVRTLQDWLKEHGAKGLNWMEV
jgi:hypothetical protein